MIGQLSNLSFIDIRSITNVKNNLLESAMDLNRPFKIYCSDTSVNTLEFEFKFPKTSKTLMERNYYQFKIKNLSFETNATKLKLNSDENPESWINNGIFVGSPFSSDDSSDWMHDFGHEDESDYQNEDDLDFLEEEQEMINELDEY